MARPEKPIDWDRVDKLLQAGCFGTEVASHFDIHPSNFYDRVKDRYGMNFTDYSSSLRQKGESILREKQYDLALSGDRVMLIFLGKTRLNQIELERKSDSSISVTTIDYSKTNFENS